MPTPYAAHKAGIMSLEASMGSDAQPFQKLR